MKKFVAVDQYGNTLFVNHPRKDLMDYHGVKHADKQYTDRKDGDVHSGYVVSGHWYTVIRLAGYIGEAA